MFHQLQFGVILFSIFLVKFAFGANILYLCALPSPSHQIWNFVLANGLAARGHNITIISPDVAKNPPKGVHHIHMEGLYSEGWTHWAKSLFTYTNELNPLTEPINFDNEWLGSCAEIVKTKGFETLLQYSDDFHFDVVLYDFTTGGCLLPFLHKCNSPPLVSLTAYGNPTISTAVVGGHQYYSYVPHYYLHYDKDMNIFQRLYNFAVHVVEYYHRATVFNPQMDELAKTKFGANIPTMTEMEQRTAVAFVNTNPAFNPTAPLPENVIPVGGLHIGNPEPLPKDIEEFIESSKKGAILFSLGTNVQSSFMDLKKQKMFLDAFESFPDYHFLWKFEDATIDLKLPKNVMIRAWIPQSDILAHPKLKAFLSHSGMLSTHEAIWRGVPILGMPFAYDQNANLLKSIQLGFAEDLDFFTLSTSMITEKLHKILVDPKYAENAKIFSARFRDQKEKPLDRAIWWIEWAIRNPNADFIKSPVLRLGFIVGNSYDVIAIVTTVAVLIIFFLVKVFFTIRQFIRNLKGDLKRQKLE